MERNKLAKVPFDAPNNSFLKVDVEGLSSHMHRFYSLGHDPLLGWIVGVIDIMKGSITTIDKTGNVVCQLREGFTGESLFKAIAMECVHLLSDVNTPMSLPAPLMTLANLLQFGSIGEQEQTIAEIVQSMYYEGFDFKHFCSQSLSVIISDVVVRIGYSIKRLADGYSIKDSLPVNGREKNPKLESMLFVSSLIAVSINSGKIIFTSNPLSFNYPQWLVFTKRLLFEVYWKAAKEPELWDEKFVKQTKMNLDELRERIQIVLDNSSNKYEIVFEE